MKLAVGFIVGLAVGVYCYGLYNTCSLIWSAPIIYVPQQHDLFPPHQRNPVTDQF